MTTSVVTALKNGFGLEAISKMPQKDEDATELDQGEEVFKMVLIAHHQSPKILQPGKEAFDLPPLPIPPERSSILGLGSFSTAAVWCDHLYTPILLQPLIKSIAVVRLVSNQPGRDFVNEPSFEGLLDKRYFMRRSAGHVHGDRKTRSVCHCHDLGAFAPLGFSHCSAPFFAGANVPSMNASRKSISPRSRRSSARATRICSKTPCFRHCWSHR